MINAEDIILTNCDIARGLFPKMDQAEMTARMTYCCTLHEQKIRELAKLLNDANLINLPVRDFGEFPPIDPKWLEPK